MTETRDISDTDGVVTLFSKPHSHVILDSCNATGTISRTSGYISSPNHPNIYDNHHHCKWIINAIGVSAIVALRLNASIDRKRCEDFRLLFFFFFQRVNITIHDFDLEFSGNCYWDALAFNDTGTNTTEVSKKVMSHIF